MFAIARMKENSRSGDRRELSSDEGPFEMHPRADMIPWVGGALLERRYIDNEFSWAASICENGYRYRSHFRDNQASWRTHWLEIAARPMNLVFR